MADRLEKTTDGPIRVEFDGDFIAGILMQHGADKETATAAANQVLLYLLDVIDKANDAKRGLAN